MEELNNVTEIVEAPAVTAVTSNNGGFWKGVGIGAAAIGGGIAIYHFGKKLVKKICRRKAEETTVETEEENPDIEPDK